MDPFDHNAALSTHDIGAGGPVRRIAASAAPTLPMPSLNTRRPKNPARQTDHRSSLCDDDEDEDACFQIIGDGKDMFQAVLSPIREKLVTVMESRGEDVTSARPWNVQDESVPILPQFHPLDRSAVFVLGTTAPVIAERIQNVLRERSIAAAYDTEGAKVKCLNKDNVDFRIRLYRGRGEFQNGFIVEVQRRDGFVLGYHMDVFAILDAAEGKEVTPMLPCPVLLNSDNDCVRKSTDPFESLTVLSEMLAPEGPAQIDHVLFALDALLSLTEPKCVGREAGPISEEILCGEACADLRHNLRALCCASSVLPFSGSLKALVVLANASTAATPGCARDLVELLREKDDELLDLLVANIIDASREPRVADLSCIILKSAFPDRGSFQQVRIMSDDLLSAFDRAVATGSQCHVDLERHCKEFLGVLLQS